MRLSILLFTWLCAAAQPPALPLRIQFHYVQQYLIEWIEGNPTYIAIEADIDGKDVAIGLTENSRAKAWYCNTQSCADRWKQRGRDTVVTNIDARIPDKAETNATFAFGFRDRHGTPVRWRFKLASAANNLAAGLTALPNLPEVQLQYRTSGAVAAAGSAVKIGDQLCEATVWTEISQPPYFVAYRGSYTDGLLVAVFNPDIIGSHAKLTFDKGAVKSTTYIDAGHTLLINFDPPLAANTHAAFKIDADKQQKIASGEASYDNNELRLRFHAPDWARDKAIAYTDHNH